MKGGLSCDENGISIGKGESLDAGEVVWMTDCTPHESLPLKAGTSRQYFRLVTSDVSVWYADHSTPNPLGIVPEEEVKIVHGNKFDRHDSCNSATQPEPIKAEPLLAAKCLTN